MPTLSKPLINEKSVENTIPVKLMIVVLLYMIKVPLYKFTTVVYSRPTNTILKNLLVLKRTRRLGFANRPINGLWKNQQSY